MLKPTMPHKDCINEDKNSFSIKIGNNVPEDAINLAYYYNVGGNTANKNILAVASPKNSIDHMELFDYREATNLEYENDKVFPNVIDYKDNDGYTGTLYRNKIDWIKHLEEDSKFCTKDVEYTELTEKKIPTSIEHSEGKMKGTLHLKKENYTPTKWDTKETNNVIKKQFKETETITGLPNPSYNFKPTKSIDKEGYKGEIPLQQSSIKYTKIENDSNVKQVVITKEYLGSSPNYPQTIDYQYNGKNYKIPVTSTTVTTGETKHYGVTRYWGYSSTGLYGTKDRKYAAHKDGGKGYFKDNKAPAQIPNRYGHFPNDLLMDYKNFTVKSAYTGWKEYNKGTNNVHNFYLDETITKVDGKAYSLGNKYTSYWNPDVMKKSSDSNVNDLTEGTEWTYDLAKAASYGAPNNLAHGGCIWASQYAEKEKNFPPKGYEKDPIYRGSEHMALVTDNAIYKDGKTYSPGASIVLEGKTYKVSDIMRYNNYPINKVQFNDFVIKRNCIFTGVTRCTTSLAYPGNQQYSKMTIMFYKSKCKKTIVTYSANLIIEAGSTYTATADYIGELQKNEQTQETYPVEWKCNAYYEGVIKHTYYLYDGKAEYRGIAIKRKSIGNINPAGLEESIMYPDGNGYLMSDVSNLDSYGVNGKNFMITDMYDEEVPLFYSHMLKNYIYDLNGPTQSGAYSGNSIKVIDDNNIELKKPYHYKIKLIPTQYPNLYRGYVFTSFKTTTNKNIYCVYNSCEVKNGMMDMESFVSGHKELLYVQEAYQKGNDFTIEELDGYRKSRIRVFNYVNMKDMRRKIAITYVVKTVDNEYVSKPIYANVLNIQYAFKSELKEFEGNNYIISPLYGKQYLTAKDILIRDLSIDEKMLEGKQITVEFFNTLSSEENHKKVYLYTNQSGNGKVLAVTSEETGFLNPNTNTYDKVYNFDSKYKIYENYIYSAFTVINKDVKNIELAAPDETNHLINWYPKIKFGSFSQVLEQYNTKMRVTYSIPEFSNQRFNSVNGEPYKYIEDEEAKIIGEHEIKVAKKPLNIITDGNKNIKNLLLYKKNSLGNNEVLTVNSYSSYEGIIVVEEFLDDTDKVYVSYEYEEEYYIYRGYYEKDVYVDLSINPNIYFDYLDTTVKPYKRKSTMDLFDKDIYFFIKPKMIENLTTNEIVVNNENVIYHKFNDTMPNGEYDLLIGKILIRHNTSLKSTVLIDTREKGGGVIKKMYDDLRKNLEPESEYYFDIGCYDGEMYSENAVIIIRLSKYLLQENGGRFSKGYISSIIDKWASYGSYYIIEYVDECRGKTIPTESIKASCIELKGEPHV